MPPKGPVSFKGPGHWRTQAEQARQPDTVFAELAEAARLLADMGKTQAQQHVHEAERALQAGDATEAAAELRAAARAAGPDAQAEADGLRAIADRIDAVAPEPEPQTKPGPVPDEGEPMAGLRTT